MNELPCILFGGPGHMREYTLNLPGYDHRTFIPRSIEVALQQRLPGWDVCNRGTRIEICHKEPFGIRDDGVVYPAVFGVVGAFNAALPVLLVLDDECNILRCAVLRERADCWDVKPLSDEHFDAREFVGNRAFHMAIWRIAKNDSCAELACDDLFFTGRVNRLAVEHAARLYAGQ